MKKLIAMILVAFALLGAASYGAGWTWDEDSGSTLIAGPHEGGEI